MTAPIDELRSVFAYFPLTGEIRRNDLPSRPNCLATTKKNAHRLRLSVNYKKKSMLAHRLAWALHTGSWPSGEIDHINGDESDNRMVNLRDTSKSVNQQNKRNPRSDNKSGFMGVCWHKGAGQWRAQITVHGKCIYLGLFPDPVTAHSAYITAKRSMHQGCTI